MQSRISTVNQLLNRETAAAKLGVSTRTIVRYERAGRIQPIRLTSRCIRYRDADIEKLIEQSTLGGDRE